MKNWRVSRISLCLLLLGWISSDLSVPACDVPVFRYALERWPADRYALTVYHRGPLTPEDQSLLDSLDARSSSQIPYSNYELSLVDLAELQPPQIPEGFDPESTSPWMELKYPEYSLPNQIVWSGALTPEVVHALPDSPARTEIAKRILNDETAVWILLDSGDTAKDDPAFSLLEETLNELEKELEIPEQTYLEGVPSADGATMPDLEIDFSVLRVSRTDPNEKFFVEMLIHSEPDLVDYASEPMAFPVYGRGRVLYALVGKGITKENITEACQFLVGPCSCQVKALNPGVDLLIAADWDAGVGESLVAEWESSTIMGVPSVPGNATGELSTAENGADPSSGPKEWANRNILWVLMAIVVINAAFVLIVKLRRSK
ncbi:MAG TPA: hypothetical protein PLY86_15325 [bacterium]|nr:hypothetical protein [bacterium]